ncbi:acetyl-CoA carboxylase biotin carboxyl carrier protein [Enterococcus sp. PF1-24]|uniref:acetyl-CoA carboxylase biotin carboxyl carrier protein n=1 Tax=unclassified Enterococcus TaxID=2608891 RepID=UPI002477225D|nr:MULTISPECIES: acetyl-CoA carboxylase biotin carboxyl carrier protein [unclassified Enterococcus]MDH6363645.1 acetyl-CoA carboxylase biotin carboxyl carrier protein [Enterococcus sp. PFB1-1]MDH6400880.1 acetyl-CoA carboxylase biotin carboxyl carrier protein [Enterococcus sp. PF1-24]
MDINEVKDLLAKFDESSLKEFELKEGTFELYMNKNEMSRSLATPTTTVVEASPVVAAPVAAAPVAPVVEVPAEKAAVVSGTEIVSPIVGVIYLKPAPDKANFKDLGDTVKKGEVVCIVEAMKVMNEITSDVDGVISEILVENEQVVEFGQALFRVK